MPERIKKHWPIIKKLGSKPVTISIVLIAITVGWGLGLFVFKWWEGDKCKPAAAALASLLLLFSSAWRTLTDDPEEKDNKWNNGILLACCFIVIILYVIKLCSTGSLSKDVLSIIPLIVSFCMPVGGTIKAWFDKCKNADLWGWYAAIAFAAVYFIMVTFLPESK